MTESLGVRCLVVDDLEELRSALARYLTEHGYQCFQAGSGREALEVLLTQEVEVLVSDIRMPEVDGVELLQQVRELYPDMAVIMVTGVREIDTAVECLRRGAYDYITKPFQPSEMHVRVQQATQKRQLILENRRYQNDLANLVRQQAARIEELFLEAIQSMVHALEAKDEYTRGHSARVSAYAAAAAAAYGLGPDEVKVIEIGAQLHDVGKIGIDGSILRKPGALTRAEYTHVMEHTLIGARILEPLMKDVTPALEIVRSHHERLDGTGLPDGLRGDQIPVHARLVSVVDAFDAMTSVRPYRPGLTPERAIAELRTHQGTQFDGAAVDAFVAAYPNTSSLPIETPLSMSRHFPIAASGLPLPQSLVR